jgi:hypothetical protein
MQRDIEKKQLSEIYSKQQTLWARSVYKTQRHTMFRGDNKSEELTLAVICQTPPH